jgi:hypothetical protein
MDVSEEHIFSSLATSCTLDFCSVVFDSDDGDDFGLHSGDETLIEGLNFLHMLLYQPSYGI